MPTPLAVAKPPPVPAPPRQQVKPPTVLLIGEPNTGKTDSIASMLEAGLEVFVIVIEANGIESLLDSCRRRRVSTDRLHWRYIPPAATDTATLLSMATKVNNLDYKGLTQLSAGIGKEDTRQLLEVIKCFDNFVDDKDGTSYGSIFQFGEDKAVVMDSMSGLNTQCLELTVGLRPAVSEGEWGVAMNMQLKLIQMLIGQLKCYFVMTAHMEKETNEVTGAQTLGAAALGRKNAPRIARLFSEIILTKRSKDGKTFSWSTWEEGLTITLKSRALPISNNLKPTFQLVVDGHKARLAQIERTQE